MRHYAYAALLIPSGLLAQALPSFYWPLNESAGTTAHEVNDLSDGLLSGECTWLPNGGHHAGALRFYGNTARVDMGPCDITTGAGNQLSVACWFKPEIVSGTERILVAKSIGPTDNDFVWSLSLVNNTGARFRVQSGGIVRSVDIPPSSIFSNTWYHLTGTYDGSTMRLFLNGSETASGAASGGMGYHPQAPATMGNVTNNGLPYYGQLDDVRIYDRALTHMEVIELVVGNVTTGLSGQGPLLRGDGSLWIPPGTWNELHWIDASGRTVAREHIRNGTTPAIVPATAGLYLVCLQGADGRITRPVVVP
jgi:hypothetical protein